MVTRMTHETPFFRREDVFTLTESPTALQLPLFAEAVPAGFPSPAGDYIEQELDLNTLASGTPPPPIFCGPAARACGTWVCMTGTSWLWTGPKLLWTATWSSQRSMEDLQ